MCYYDMYNVVSRVGHQKVFEAMMYTTKNEEAAAPVVAVILIVAITVIIASIIAAFGFGMAEKLPKTNVLAASAEHRDIGGTQTLFITYKGGPDAGQVQSLAVNFNANAPMSISTVIGTAVSTTSGVLSSNDNHVVVTATFFDGTTQVILDTYV
jgi:archaeal type IV pilus assembly protein PilA